MKSLDRYAGQNWLITPAALAVGQPPPDCLAILFAMRRASSSEIFLVRQGTGESVMTFWLVASA